MLCNEWHVQVSLWMYSGGDFSSSSVRKVCSPSRASHGPTSWHGYPACEGAKSHSPSGSSPSTSRPRPKHSYDQRAVQCYPTLTGYHRQHNPILLCLDSSSYGNRVAREQSRRCLRRSIETVKRAECSSDARAEGNCTKRTPPEVCAVLTDGA